MRKKLLAVVMAACMTFGTAAALPQAFFSDTYITASAEYFESSDFGYYVKEDSTLTVAKYIGNGGDVKIPKRPLQICSRVYFITMILSQVSPFPIV